VVVGMDAELEEERPERDVNETEDIIVSQWREVSGDEKHQLRDAFDEIVRRFGLQTRLVVLERANSIASYFLCMTLSAVMSLRDQWSSGQLRDIVQKLFTFLSGATGTVWVKRLTWPLTDYERCLEFFHYTQGNGRFSYRLIIFWQLAQLSFSVLVCYASSVGSDNFVQIYLCGRQ